MKHGSDVSLICLPSVHASMKYLAASMSYLMGSSAIGAFSTSASMVLLLTRLVPSSMSFAWLPNTVLISLLPR